MYPGHPFYWNITVCNTGNVDLDNIWVNDTQLGFSQQISLEVGECAYFLLNDSAPSPFALSMDAVDTAVIMTEHCNHVDVDYFYCHMWFHEYAEDCISVVIPDLEVTKTATCLEGEPIEEMYPGHPMLWNITVTNTGNVPLDNIWVNDTMLNFSEQISLAPGESMFWDIPYAPSLDDASDYIICNEVVVDYFYCHMWFQETGEDCIFVVIPDATVEKVALHDFDGDLLPIDEIGLGHEIIWNVTVCNTGNVALNISVEDEMLDINETISLQPGECRYYEIPMVVTENDINDDGDLICNYVEIEWTYCHWTFMDSDEWCVFVAMPGMEVTKEKLGLPFSAANHTIEWMINVTNTGNVDLMSVDIEDALTGDAWYGETIPVGTTWSEIVSYDVPADWCNQTECDAVCNVVDVTADVYGDEHAILTDSAENCVFIHCPCVEITKTKLGEFNYSAPGHTIEWEISVYNCGNIPLGFLDVVDCLTDDHLYIYNLGVGEWYNFTVSYDVPSDICCLESDYVINVANVTVDVYNDTHCYLYDEDVSEVFIHCPSMEIAKTALDEFSAANHTTEWLLEVWNTGNIPLENVTIDDPNIGFYQTGIYLPVEGYWSQVVNYVVPEEWCSEEMGDYLYNEMFVTADVYDNGHCVLEDSANDSVFIMCPCIDVEKTGPAEICWGNEVIWTINVTNCGNVPLEHIMVVDPLTGFETVIPALDIGESIEFETSIFIPYGFCETEWLDNEVLAWTWLFGDHCNVSDAAQHSVFIAKPDIDLIKTGPETAVRGETIVYELTVVNDGNVPLWDITVTDPYLDLEVFIEHLDVGESQTILVEFTIPLCWECEHFTNWAEVDAWYYGTYTIMGCFTEDDDCHEVEILEQELTILKTGPDKAYPGDTITFVINVTNTGEVPLSDVMVWDPMLGMEWCVGELDVGESWEVSVEYTIPFCYEGDGLVNWAYASGTYHGVTVDAGDGWAVFIEQDPCQDPTQQVLA